MWGWLKWRQAPAAPEKRASGTGYTAAVMAARESYIAGAGGLAELTGTAQACVSLWEGAFTLADVTGTDLLTRGRMAMIGRGLALRGEVAMLITGGGLVPFSDWDLSTRDGIPRAYRGTINDAGGGRSVTALAAEVLHVRIGADPITPWAGRAPLRRAPLSASLLDEVEGALRDVFRDAPFGSQIIHLPEGSAEDMEAMRQAFRGRRGSSLVVEGVAQATAAGMNPNIGRSPDQLTPDLNRAAPAVALEAARGAILAAFGVLPGMFQPAAQGPLVREAQRHLAGWVLQPMAELLAEEASAKLGAQIMVDVGRPLQAFDAGGRARALSALIEAMGRAKELGLSPEEIGVAFKSVNWGGGDALA
jgi:hypothetical protein